MIQLLLSLIGFSDTIQATLTDQVSTYLKMIKKRRRSYQDSLSRRLMVISLH
jgi:hypothetical protein